MRISLFEQGLALVIARLVFSTLLLTGLLSASVSLWYKSQSI
jgi:hypothetical protein